MKALFSWHNAGCRTSRLVLGMLLVIVSFSCGKRRFEKWNLIKVREVVPPAELVWRGFLDPTVKESRVFYMTGFEKQPPDAPSLRRWFSIKITEEESNRIIHTLLAIFPAEYVPKSVRRFSRKSRQNYAVTAYRCRSHDRKRWLYFSAVSALTLDPDPRRGVIFVKGFIGNIEPIRSYDDVYRVARRHMNPEFLGKRSSFVEWKGPTDKAQIKALAKRLEGSPTISEEDLRRIPRTFKLDNFTSRTYLRGGKTTLNEAGTLLEMYGIGFRYFPVPERTRR